MLNEKDRSAPAEQALGALELASAKGLSESTTSVPGGGIRRNPLRSLVQAREFFLAAFIIVAMIALNMFQPGFLGSDNVKLILLGISFDAIIAVGMTILLVSGGFDLSVGAVMALSGVVSGMLMNSGMNVPLAIVVGLLAGLVIGLVNGFFIAYVGINAFITTLGMMSVVQGLTLLLSQSGVSGFPDSFNNLGQGTWLSIQFPILIMIVFIIAGDLLLRNSRFLRKNYYIGGNERSAVLSGISVKRQKLFNYALTGLLAAIAGILTAAREASASPTTGGIDALNIIAAVVIGGASLAGGEGTVLGAFLGLVLLQVITNAITGFGFNPNWGPLITGAVLLVAVTADLLGRRVRFKRKVRPTAHVSSAQTQKTS